MVIVIIIIIPCNIYGLNFDAISLHFCNIGNWASYNSNDNNYINSNRL